VELLGRFAGGGKVGIPKLTMGLRGRTAASACWGSRLRRPAHGQQAA
jgi:hypothetical protein